MSDIGTKETAQQPSSPKNSKWRRRMWHFAVTFAILNGISLLLGEESRAKLKEINNSFVASVEAVDPFVLGRLYWNYVWYHDDSFMHPDEPERTKIPVPLRSNSPNTLVRIVTGVYHVCVYGCTTGGPVSIVVTIIALAVAVFLVTDGFMELDLFRWIIIPFVAAVFVFALLLVLWVIGWLFGSFLVAAQLIAAIEGTILGMFWKVGEHHAVDKLIGKATGHG